MHNDDIRQLLVHCTDQIEGVEESISDGELNRILLKNTLENLRSVLDYLAQDIVIKLKTKPKNGNLSEKVYFPYGQRENHFNNSVKRNLPPLKEDEPKIYDLLESIQPFKSKDNWVVDLCSLTNDAKHNSLSKTESQENTVVEQKGFARIEGGRNVMMVGNYFNGVRQDDVFIDGDGNANVVRHSGTTLVTTNTRIKFHGKELEIVPFLNHCHKQITELSRNAGSLL
ncbi:hypothetical protein CLH62_18170 [Marinobacter guineae]|uniref:Uncharacterized protein n=1 Tax=Marinobacter guineae TaxID=432303 RepID=A0A2G1VBI7_9GAMM|nr:hypothetical protein [Marinobacter guineae]PHQ24042.1 hypothetical protein CLH62_18170 [Marinobacter guineae]